MASLNKVTLIGNLGSDPEIRSTQAGKEIASFRLATSETWKDKTTGEKKEKTEWHNVIVFNEGTAAVIKNYVKKGSKLYVEGALQTRKYLDKEGVERYVTDVIVQGFDGKIILLDKKQDSGHEAQKRNGYIDDDYVPF